MLINSLPKLSLITPMRNKFEGMYRGGGEREGKTPVATACPEDCRGQSLLRVKLESKSDDLKKKKKINVFGTQRCRSKKRKVRSYQPACIIWWELDVQVASLSARVEQLLTLMPGYNICDTLPPSASVASNDQTLQSFVRLFSTL